MSINELYVEYNNNKHDIIKSTFIKRIIDKKIMLYNRNSQNDVVDDILNDEISASNRIRKKKIKKVNKTSNNNKLTKDDLNNHMTQRLGAELDIMRYNRDSSKNILQPFTKDDLPNNSLYSSFI